METSRVGRELIVIVYVLLPPSSTRNPPPLPLGLGKREALNRGGFGKPRAGEGAGGVEPSQDGAEPGTGWAGRGRAGRGGRQWLGPGLVVFFFYVCCYGFVDGCWCRGRGGKQAAAREKARSLDVRSDFWRLRRRGSRDRLENGDLHREKDFTLSRDPCSVLGGRRGRTQPKTCVGRRRVRMGVTADVCQPFFFPSSEFSRLRLQQTALFVADAFHWCFLHATDKAFFPLTDARSFSFLVHLDNSGRIIFRNRVRASTVAALRNDYLLAVFVITRGYVYLPICYVVAATVPIVVVGTSGVSRVRAHHGDLR